mgnify:CR=1 FL=1
MVLHLVLKAQWYNMIEQGIKKEEYREIKQYWMHRLMLCHCYGFRPCKYESCAAPMPNLCHGIIKEFDEVCFHYGYTSRTMTFKIESICVEKGKPEWGAEDGKQYFVIKLGERIKED